MNAPASAEGPHETGLPADAVTAADTAFLDDLGKSGRAFTEAALADLGSALRAALQAAAPHLAAAEREHCIAEIFAYTQKLAPLVGAVYRDAARLLARGGRADMQRVAGLLADAPQPAGPARTVGDVREALAALLGIAKAEIGHYAFVVDAVSGTILKFCCDDRRAAAAMFREAARLLLSEPGESMLEDRQPPPMPEPQPAGADSEPHDNKDTP